MKKSYALKQKVAFGKLSPRLACFLGIPPKGKSTTQRKIWNATTAKCSPQHTTKDPLGEQDYNFTKRISLLEVHRNTKGETPEFADTPNCRRVAYTDEMLVTFGSASFFVDAKENTKRGKRCISFTSLQKMTKADKEHRTKTELLPFLPPIASPRATPFDLEPTDDPKAQQASISKQIKLKLKPKRLLC